MIILLSSLISLTVCLSIVVGIAKQMKLKSFYLAIYSTLIVIVLSFMMWFYIYDNTLYEMTVYISGVLLVLSTVLLLLYDKDATRIINTSVTTSGVILGLCFFSTIRFLNALTNEGLDYVVDLVQMVTIDLTISFVVIVGLLVINHTFLKVKEIYIGMFLLVFAFSASFTRYEEYNTSFSNISFELKEAAYLEEIARISGDYFMQIYETEEFVYYQREDYNTGNTEILKIKKSTFEYDVLETFAEIRFSTTLIYNDEVYVSSSDGLYYVNNGETFFVNTDLTYDNYYIWFTAIVDDKLRVYYNNYAIELVNGDGTEIDASELYQFLEEEAIVNRRSINHIPVFYNYFDDERSTVYYNYEKYENTYRLGYDNGYLCLDDVCSKGDTEVVVDGYGTIVAVDQGLYVLNHSDPVSISSVETGESHLLRDGDFQVFDDYLYENRFEDHYLGIYQLDVSEVYIFDTNMEDYLDTYKLVYPIFIAPWILVVGLVRRFEGTI